MNNKIPKVRLDRAMKHYGGRKQLAEFLGISQEAIMNMQRQGKIYLPSTRAFQVYLDKPDLAEKTKAA